MFESLRENPSRVRPRQKKFNRYGNEITACMSDPGRFDEAALGPWHSSPKPRGLNLPKR